MLSVMHTRLKQFGIPLLFLLIFFSAAFFLHNNKIQKEKTRFSEYITNLSLAYQSGVQSYHLAMDGFFANALNQPEITDLLAEVPSAPEEKQNILRGHLYRLLFPAYERMQQQYVRQLQFYLPDGTTFLRFNKPEHYNDSLFDVRTMVRIANEEQRVVHGFEIGKISAGFRFIYPLRSKGQHVGSVEVVLTTKVICDALSAMDGSREFTFLMSRALAESTLFPDQLTAYSQSEMNADFLVEDATPLSAGSLPALSSTAQRINRILRDQTDVRDQMRSGQPMARAVSLEGQTYVVTMLPLQDPNLRLAGYLVTYTPDLVLPAVQQELYLYLVGVLLSACLLGFLQWRVYRQTRTLDTERQNLIFINDALRAREEQCRRLSAVVEQGPDGVLMTDAHGTIEYVNPKFEHMTGYTLDEAVGKKPPALLATSETMKGIHKDLPQIVRTQKTWKGELANRRKDGTQFWATLSITPIYDQEGDITHYVAILEDSTERLRMEQSLRESEVLQRSITEHLPVGLMIIDAETRIIEQVNPQAARMFGAPAENIVGNRCHRFLCPAEENSCPIGDLKQVVDKSDRMLVRQDGSHLPILKTVTTITLQGRTKYLECFVDILERKTVEDALLKANIQLEEAIGRAEKLAQEADAANQAKGAFLANMSHEIRTPMNAIIGMTHLALRTDLTAQQHDYLTKVDLSAKSLLGILNDILDFSKIEAGKIELEQVEFSLIDVLENVAAVISVRLSEADVEFVVDVDRDVPERLIGDPLRLSQVLINLAGNAMKFTDKGEVRISIGLSEMLPGARVRLFFQILDTGIGMDETQASKLFEPFVQADASISRRYGGTGLGLSISRRLVSLMGGTLTATSIQGHGSVFSYHGVFGLPDQTGAQVLPQSLCNARVLVVDDLDSSRYAVLGMLHDMGLTASGYASPREAMEEMQGEEVDFILLDWSLPGTNAVEVWQNMPGLSHTPKAILLAPLGQEWIMRQAVQAGFSGVVTKPVFKNRLVEGLLVATQGFGLSEKLYLRDDDAVYFEGGRVLLVEDNEINQQVAKTILESAGLTVLLAADGMEAVAMARAESVDLILMDLQMPRMDGYEATRQIRALPGLQDVPIVAMTAHAVSTVRDDVLAAGMTDCLTKPIDVREFYAMLGTWFTLVSGVVPPASGSASIHSKDNAPVLLVEEGVARFMGERELYFDSVASFQHTYKDACSQFKEQCAAGQGKDARILVHSLRGIAGNLGAKALHLAASSLEEQMIEYDIDVKEEYINEFCTQVTRLMEEIETILQKNDKSEKHVLDSDELRTLLDTLIPYLQNRKPKGCRDVLHELRSRSVPAALEADVENMEKLVQAYDFPTALHVATTLRNSLNTVDAQ
ncbi:hypothetical protein MASR1M90_03540 [Desulfovibrionales bacterium]